MVTKYRKKQQCKKNQRAAKKETEQERWHCCYIQNRVAEKERAKVRMQRQNAQKT